MRDASTRMCANCGTLVPATAYQCYTCGAYVDGGAAAAHAKMPTGMQVLMWLNLISGFFMVATGGLMFLFGIISMFGEAGAGGLVIVFVGAIFGGLGYLFLTMSKKLGQGDNNARSFFMVISGLGCLAFPVGTIINGLFLWSLMSEEGKLWCSGPTRQRPKLEGGIVIALVVGLGALVLIGGIISAIAVPSFTKARDKAQGKACFATQRVYSGGIEMWEMDNFEGEAMPSGVIIEGDGTPGPVGEALMGDYVQELYVCHDGGEITYDADTHIVECSEHGSIPEVTDSNGY